MQRIQYVVCTSPRSGSGLLCEALWNSRLAGRPDEYFFEGTEEEYSRSWGTSGSAEYLARAVEYGTSENGVFGFKIMRSHLARFTECYASRSGRGDGAARGVLEEVFPGLQYVWLSRRDKVRQAVSLWKRLQTGVHHWCGDTPMQYSTRPRYDYEAIRSLVLDFETWDREWAGYFSRHGLSPLRLHYEDDLEDDCAIGVRRVLELLEVSQAGNVTVRTTRRKQRDALSDEFVERYYKDSTEGRHAALGDGA